jgi:hypothetical protein
MSDSEKIEGIRQGLLWAIPMFCFFALYVVVQLADIKRRLSK